MASSVAGSQAPRTRLSVGVVGAGRVGAVLGAALNRAGHEVVSVSAVSQASRLRAATLLPKARIANPVEVAQAADLLVLTVPDDSLAGLAQGLAAAIKPGTFVMHTAGRFGISVLAPMEQALPMAVHPAMTFTGTAVDLPKLSGCPFAVTAQDALLTVAQSLVVEMGGEPVWVAEQFRPLYHASLANVANHLMTLVGTSADLLSRCGIENPTDFMTPLLNAALENALRYGDQALTGPAVRGDFETLTEHVRLLATVDKQVADAYLTLAILTVKRAMRAGRLSQVEGNQVLEGLVRLNG